MLWHAAHSATSDSCVSRSSKRAGQVVSICCWRRAQLGMCERCAMCGSCCKRRLRHMASEVKTHLPCCRQGWAASQRFLIRACLWPARVQVIGSNNQFAMKRTARSTCQRHKLDVQASAEPPMRFLTRTCVCMPPRDARFNRHAPCRCTIDRLQASRS